MQKLFKNWRILLWLAAVALSIFSIMFIGIQYGIDFKGGTLFQVHLAEKPTPEQLSEITSIIQQRVDSFGFKDSKVNSFGEDFVIVQIAETDPKEVESTELLLKTQGKFEATLDGNVLFNGSEIVQIIRDPTQYGVSEGTQAGSGFSWNLPFTLNDAAAKRFSQLSFHQCTILDFSVTGGNQYDCKQTYFFIDRPSDSVLVISKQAFDRDTGLFFSGVGSDISAGQSIEELMLNAGMKYFVVEGEISTEQLEQINVLNKTQAIVHSDISVSSRAMLASKGMLVKEIPVHQSLPWLWVASGARTVISLTPGVTGMDPFIENPQNAKLFYDLSISGQTPTLEEAQLRLQELDILLKTGSLPIPIDEVSKETISPFLGKEFADSSVLIGLVALLCVAGVLFVRYRRIKIALPIAITGLSEVIIILGFSSFFRINLDLASVAGILTVIGTGVNQQIIITDELLSGESQSAGSLSAKSKRAFFIVMASAATLISTMLPMIFFGFGLGKLVGFAVTTILGVLIGVLIARPAFTEVAKYVLEGEGKN